MNECKHGHGEAEWCQKCAEEYERHPTEELRELLYGRRIAEWWLHTDLANRALASALRVLNENNKKGDGR